MDLNCCFTTYNYLQKAIQGHFNPAFRITFKLVSFVKFFRCFYLRFFWLKTLQLDVFPNAACSRYTVFSGVCGGFLP